MSRPPTAAVDPLREYLTATESGHLDDKFAAVNGDFARLTLKGKDDAAKLQGKVNDWRDDVSTLATHIAAQLQFCKSLRTSKAMALIPNVGATSESKGEVDIFRLLRSDIRSLYDFRLAYLPGLMDAARVNDYDIDKEAGDMKALLHEASTVDKADPIAAFDTLLKFVQAKSDLVSRIAEDFVARKKQMDLDRGIEDEMDMIDDSAALLLSRDTKLFMKMGDSFHALYKEVKTRQARADKIAADALVATSPSNNNNATGGNPPSGAGRAAFFAVSDGADTGKGILRADEANFTIQKLQREVNELKIQKAKLMSTNSQLEDNYAHISAQYELEKKTHQANVKWHEPRIQKLEDGIRTTSKALSELRLNVDLITNMYKKTCDDVVEFEKDKGVVLRERDVLSQKLYDEIKKMSVVNLELVRKDKLIMFAMGARHEVIKCWNDTKAALAEMTKERDDLIVALRNTKDSLRLLEGVLEETQTTCQEYETELDEKDEAIGALRGNIEEITAAHEVRVSEKSKRYEEEYDKLLAKYDKTKKELVETVQDNIILDGKLRAAHDRISRFLS
ncbi:Aste57867_20707 [Aphanomyces stellatus]|uniref:Aste57867_20707 protein n=1 Tax=Aphanomyces stellatus TaxID=120398 RepID=A0A485LGV6_9STRA|nr:hypothetical protein As57867_020639 [Aphanomyces stellatus]VFT97387.1 Aste57867_20707 [Aphanomyces stellatus]